MKRIIAIVIILGCLCLFTDGTKAETNFFSASIDMISEVADMSQRNTIELSTTNAYPKVCSITFDFTEGNQTIVLVEESACKVCYYFDDDELLSIVFHMITKFNQVNLVIPQGYSLQYVLRFSDTEVYYITSETLSKYYSWMNN